MLETSKGATSAFRLCACLCVCLCVLVLAGVILFPVAGMGVWICAEQS